MPLACVCAHNAMGSYVLPTHLARLYPNPWVIQLKYEGHYEDQKRRTRLKAKETLINSFAVIPANAGIQLPIELKALDSGSPLRYAWNNELFSASLSIAHHNMHFPRLGLAL